MLWSAFFIPLFSYRANFLQNFKKWLAYIKRRFCLNSGGKEARTEAQVNHRTIKEKSVCPRMGHTLFIYSKLNYTRFEVSAKLLVLIAFHARNCYSGQ